MPGRLVRSQTAHRVAQLLGSRKGREHLAAFGWKPGMPVIMTQPSEKLDDVMGLVSVHQGPVLVAMTEPSTEDLRFLHISEPSPALMVVEPCRQDHAINNLFEQAERAGMSMFRVKYWKYSAVAHAIPVFDYEAHSFPQPEQAKISGES